MKRWMLFLAVPVLAVIAVKALPSAAPDSGGTSPALSRTQGREDAAQKYTCAMHHQIISDKPGQCPICGMDLVPVAAEPIQGMPESEQDSGDAAAKSERKVLYWHDPMNPGKQFDKPGKSPFMDMELVPKYADEEDGDAAGGKPVVTVSAENLQKVGVRTDKSARIGVGQSIRATGIVTENERSRRDVYTQVEGRVTGLDLSAVGDVVTKGQPFYTLYSPELLTFQNDYIAALETGLKDVAEAARRRMRLLGVEEAVLDEVAKSRKAYEEVPFSAPADGVLSKLEVRKGAYIMAGSMMGTIQDLSTIWIEAAVPEGDLRAIREGAAATVSFGGDSTQHAATVDYVYPDVTPETRTGKVRLVLDNQDRNLKPAGYAIVRFAGSEASGALTVPSEAILRTSTGEHVIVALGAGKFQAREVKTGAAGGGRTEILEGLREGEDVVTSAQFLIDSESSLRESLQKMSGGEHAGH
jgi:multidrug efflux pump subunit AcrA (membrane-fusion protein)